jgi:hypothetical protein
MCFSTLFFFNPSFIKNIDKPICKDCKYFKSDISYKDYHYGQCTKFGKKDLISGKIIFEDVILARAQECGVNATYFENKDLP